MVTLTKGQSVSPEKPGGGSLTRVIMGLGWDVRKSGGFFGFGGGGGDIDLDASCVMFDGSGRQVDVVWFRQLKSRDGSVVHTGDNLTGAGDGDDEQIIVPAGFALSAPLFEAIHAPDLLREEVERDLEHGLLTKTAIHPSQVEVIQSVYRVAAGEADAARAILNPNGRAVFKANGAMCETATHGAWAREVLARQSLYGGCEERVAADAAPG